MVTERAVAGARVVYVGDERDNSVAIGMARNRDISEAAPYPGKIIGFLVQGASASLGCEPGRIQGDQVCRVPDGTRLLAPRADGRGGRDTIKVYVPRRGAIVHGGPGNDILEASCGCAAEVPSELHGGAGRDYLSGGGLLDGGAGDDRTFWARLPSRILGGPGDDRLLGSAGPDMINPGPGRDYVNAAQGNDVIGTLDGQIDTVVCSSGRDSLVANGRDEPQFSLRQIGPFADCERLQRRGEPLVGPFRFALWDGQDYLTILSGCPPDGPALCVGTVALRREGHLIARRRLRARAGTWEFTYFELGWRRIAELPEGIRITIRWRDRAGRMRSRTKLSQIRGPNYD
jgi:RTX calcium-binding nonapeptide repeat (4 copies)